MQFFYYFPGRWLPLNEELVNGPNYVRLAQEAERQGFNGVCMDEHPAPVESWLNGPGGHHCFDPFVFLAGIAGATSRIKILTYLSVLGYRHPFLFTKAATSLDIMSDGRLVLGAGVGYLEGEFRALGVDFAQRNTLFDEVVDVFRRACTGEPVPVGTEGESVIMLPRPVQRPHPPLWIGGSSQLSRRRAVDYGQGWMPMPQRRNHPYHKTPPLENPQDLRDMTDWMMDYAAKVGRTDPIDIVISSVLVDTTAPWERQLEQFREFEAIGATAVTLNGQGTSLSQAMEYIQAFGENVIAPLNAGAVAG